MKKLTVNKQVELFAQDCKLINLRYEYSGFTGTEKWAIITELSEEALWDKYPDVISRYTPFILLSMAQGEVISESHRNNDKYEKRSKRTIDVYGYEDDIFEQFHPKSIAPFIDPFDKAEEEQIEEAKEKLRQLELSKVRQALSMLQPVQRERLLKSVLLGISSNHTLVYYDHRTDGSKKGCYFNVNTPKTPAGKRKVLMLSFVKEAIIMEKERQELLDLHCIATIDGYTDFIFINRFGNPQHQGTLNKAIRRIIRDCNDEQFLKNENPEVLLPHFSCHSLRHTFTTRMCEAGVNVKVIQDTLGHKDISTTLNIYTDVTKELRQSEFEGLDSYFKSEYNEVSNE